MSLPSNLELFPHFVIKMLLQLAPGLRHRLVDLEVQLKLKLIKGRFDFLGFCDIAGIGWLCMTTIKYRRFQR
jgi:hypothetical protein